MVLCSSSGVIEIRWNHDRATGNKGAERGVVVEVGAEKRRPVQQVVKLMCVCVPEQDSRDGVGVTDKVGALEPLSVYMQQRNE